MFILNQPLHGHSSYEKVSILGDGDQSIVYLVKDETESLFALKEFYNSELALKEYQLSQHLIHPSIIRIYEQFESCLVMEYVDGMTLRKAGAKCHFSQTAAENALGFLSALIHAGKAGLIHRDLHGSNIMFDHNDRLKLIDLESFCAIEECIYQTNQQYLKNVMGLLMEILYCGDFSEEELDSLKSDIKNVLSREVYINPMAESVNQESQDLFIKIIKDCIEIINFKYKKI